MSTTGEKIKKVREQKGFSQETLVTKIRESGSTTISRKSLSTWESGKNLPKTENLAAVADALGVPVADLMGDESPNTKKEPPQIPLWDGSQKKSYPAIGSKIKEARKNRGLSRPALAEAINISANTLWRWETDQRQPSFEMVQAIANVLCIPIPNLVDDAADSQPDAEPFVIRNLVFVPVVAR